MCDRNVDEIPCKQKPCQPRARPKPSDDVNAGLKGRPVLYTGVVWIGIVRRFLIPRSCYQCQQRCGPCEEKDSKQKGLDKNPPKPVAHLQEVDSAIHEPPLKYKQIPLTPQPCATDEEDESEDPKAVLLRKEAKASDFNLQSGLKALVVQVHEVKAAVAEHAAGFTDDLTAILRDGQETTAEVIETVRGEDAKMLRMAAVSAGGVFGCLAGWKRGIPTRLVYSATGATAVATICYPEEAKRYNRRGLATARRWMLLGLALVHDGPQNPLGGGDTSTADNTIFFDHEQTNSSVNDLSQNESSFTGDMISNLKQRFGSLWNNRFGEIKNTRTETDSVTVTNESSAENFSNSDDYDSEINTSPENVSHINSLENLSSNKEPDVMIFSTQTIIPSSANQHAPPVSQHKIILHPINPDELEIKDLQESMIAKRNNSREFLQLQEADELIVLDVDFEENIEEEQEEEDDDDFPENTFFIPTGELEEKLEGIQESPKKSRLKKNDDTPIQNKLTVYYRNMPEEEKTSREKGYDDAYSNRGK